MPAGSVNAPELYLCMMGNLKKNGMRYWTRWWSHTLCLKKIDDKKVHILNGNIHLDSDWLYSGTKSIIDNVLIWSSNIWCFLIHFECVCRVFQKYRISFRQNTYHFLLDRVEYVGYNLLSDENCPEKSKFNMIDDCKLPPTGRSLHLFVGLVSLYHRYAPYLEMWLKPLRILITTYFRNTIPTMAWTRYLIKLFEDTQMCVNSSPVLVQYDSRKLIFLKDRLECQGDGLNYDAALRWRRIDCSHKTFLRNRRVYIWFDLRFLTPLS